MNSGYKDALRIIGRVRSVNPSRREVRIAYDSPARVLAEGTQWLWFDDAAGRRRRCKVAEARAADGIVALAPGVTRDTVSGLRGATVLAADTSRPEGAWPAPGDLVGMRLVAQDGSAVGVVIGVIEGAVQDVVRVERPDGGRFLLPLVAPAVLGADAAAAVLTVASDLAAYAVDEP